MPKTQIWNRYFLKLAEITSTLSKDPRTKVGSVIVTQDNRNISIGYNGFARGVIETESMWNDRDLKHELVVHSEINNILNCPFNTHGCKIYITHQPCHRCMIHLINAGILEVYYIHPYLKAGSENIIKTHLPLFKVFEKVSIDI